MSGMPLLFYIDMSKVFLMIILALLMMCGSCCPCKNLTTETSTHDSIRVETNTVTVYVPDTVLIEIPLQTAERTTADSTSHLENDYATSDARINADGTLFHSLNTKPQEKPVEVKKKEVRKDNIVYKGHTEKETEEKIVQVTPSWAWYVLLYAVATTISVIFLIRRKL